MPIFILALLVKHESSFTKATRMPYICDKETEDKIDRGI